MNITPPPNAKVLPHSVMSVETPARSPLSGVCWGAIFAGAAGAAALSLTLLIIGTGLGLSAISPWAARGIDAQSFGVSSIVWITFTHLLAAGLGGYLAGRLRSQWLGVQTDEIYFRDTAHGFLAWAVSSLASAALLSGAITSIVGGGLQAGASIAKAGAEMAPMSYVVNSLFRQLPTTAANTATANTATRTGMTAEVTAEVTGIFLNTLRSGELQAEDQRYVAHLVAQRTGLSETEASQRVAQAYLQVKNTVNNAENSTREAVDKARKTSAYVSLWLAVALLGGAFVASFAATLGGRQRDC